MAKSKKELIEERGEKVKEYRALVDKAETEKRELSAEEDSKLDSLKGEIDSLDKKIQRAEFIEGEEKRKADLDDLQRRSDDLGGSEGEKERRNAFIQYLRDPEGMTTEQRKLMVEMRAQGAGTDNKGGYLVSKELGDKVIGALKSLGGFLNEVEVLTTSTGGALSFPTVDDTTYKATIVAEGVASSEGDITFGVVTLNSFTYRSVLIPVSFELLQDSKFDLVGLLSRLIANSIWRAINEHVTTGDGSGKPTGVIGCTKGADAAAAAITYDNLVDLEASVDPAYRNNAKFMMNGKTLAIIKKLKDSTGRPLWEPNVQSGSPSLLLGYPVILNPDMPDVGASKKSIVFGDMKGYTLRQAAGVGIMRLNERLADKLSVGFFGYARFDGKITNASALRHLLHAAS